MSETTVVRAADLRLGQVFDLGSHVPRSLRCGNRPGEVGGRPWYSHPCMRFRGAVTVIDMRDAWPLYFEMCRLKKCLIGTSSRWGTQIYRASWRWAPRAPYRSQRHHDLTAASRGLKGAAMDSFDESLLDFACRWLPYGGAPLDEVLVRFGMTPEIYAQRLLELLDSVGARVVSTAHRQELRRQLVDDRYRRSRRAYAHAR